MKISLDTYVYYAPDNYLIKSDILLKKPKKVNIRKVEPVETILGQKH